MKAAGAVYRNALAWSLQERLGIRMEQYGKDGEFIAHRRHARKDLIGHWSKRRAAIIEAAREMGFTVVGNAPRGSSSEQDHADRQVAGQRSGDSPSGAGEAKRRAILSAKC